MNRMSLVLLFPEYGRSVMGFCKACLFSTLGIMSVFFILMLPAVIYHAFHPTAASQSEHRKPLNQGEMRHRHGRHWSAHVEHLEAE